MSNSRDGHFNTKQYRETEYLEKKDDKCTHDWKYWGHGHNYSLYKCTKCRKEEEY